MDLGDPSIHTHFVKGQSIPKTLDELYCFSFARRSNFSHQSLKSLNLGDLFGSAPPCMVLMTRACQRAIVPGYPVVTQYWVSAHSSTT